jgi:hypothetical protein
VIGIDIGKNSFHVVGHDTRGAIVLWQNWSRGQVEARLANLPARLTPHRSLPVYPNQRPLSGRPSDITPMLVVHICKNPLHAIGDAAAWRNADRKITGQ